MKNAPPALYALALLGFFLPWCSLTCSVPEPAGGQTIKISQSGLQMITGGTSITVDGKSPSDVERKEIEKDDEGGPDQAMLLILFPIALVVGIAMSFSNLQAAGIAGIVAFAIAILQMAIGFPLHDVEFGPPGMASNTVLSQPDALVRPVVFQPDMDKEAFQKGMEEFGDQMGEVGGMIEGMDDIQKGAGAMLEQVFDKKTEPFFWLSSLASLVGAVLCFVAINQATATAAAPQIFEADGSGEGSG